MRITTHMLNKSMVKAGLPVNSMSLLDCMKSSGAQNNDLLSALKKGSTVSQTQKKDYEKLKKSAENLQQSAEKLQDEKLFEEARNSGDASSIREHVEQLLEYYNKTINSLKSSASPLNQYYRETLLEAAQEGKDGLTSIGITQGRDGVLSLDEEKFKGADTDTLEQVLGGTFTERVSFLSDRIADNAKANASSASTQYNALGSQYFAQANTYNFWG